MTRAKAPGDGQNRRRLKEIRASLLFEAEFFGTPIEKWTRKFIAANKWRVPAIYDYEDLLQECYLKFMYVKDKYPEVIEPKHFMALYTRAVANHFHSRLAKKRQQSIEQKTISSDDPDNELIINARAESTINAGPDRIALQEATGNFWSAGWKKVVDKVLEHPEALRESNRREESGKRETTRQFLSRVLAVEVDEISAKLLKGVL